MARESQIRIVIADDHRLFRELLRVTLRREESIKIVGEAVNGPQTIDIIDRLKPDVVLLDITMPEMDGIEVVAPIIKKSPKTKALMLTASMDEASIFKTLKAGAKGYISKDTGISDLIKAIQTVHQGEIWIERKLIARFFDENNIVDSKKKDQRGRINPGLTQREHEVLGLLATGCTNKDIAQTLFISEKTVKSHLHNIFRKLKVTRRLQAILYAINHGLR